MGPGSGSWDPRVQDPRILGSGSWGQDPEVMGSWVRILGQDPGILGSWRIPGPRTDGPEGRPEGVRP